MDWKLITSLNTDTDDHVKSFQIKLISPNTTNGVAYSASSLTTINPGELPGYTGWARPEKTLAGFFSVLSISNEMPTAGSEFFIRVECRGHQDCMGGSSLFFLRAYGPSVIPGVVVRPNDDSSPSVYEFKFLFFDPGQYTVEVVLTFSSSPHLNTFPMNEVWQQPAYEGYMLPEFPLLLTVQQKEYQPKRDRSTSEELCSFEELTVSSSTEELEKARWVVTSKSNGPGYTSNTINSAVSKRGYIENVNSLGINMDYRYLSLCNLMTTAAFHRSLYNKRVFAQCPKKIQIVYIGDSVLRVQKEKLRSLANGVPTVNFQFLSLHLGYRRNQILGPSHVQDFLDNLHRKYPNDTMVILFNTGLHDIHQLCGADNFSDRYKYLNRTVLDSGTFSCVTEYRALLREFALLIQHYPGVQLKVFQTSTAAWPKYGNWGIGWETNPQGMPLVSDFCTAFNDIAWEVLHELQSTTRGDVIYVMDAYWMTYSRPDNREFGAIGNKLSHPGDEVLSIMSRIWAKIILDKVC